MNTYDWHILADNGKKIIWNCLNRAVENVLDSAMFPTSRDGKVHHKEGYYMEISMPMAVPYP